MDKENILCLDAATSFGWAVYLNDELHDYGNNDYKKEKSWNDKYLKAYEFIKNKVHECNINRIVIEQMDLMRNCKTIRVLNGLVGVCKLAAYRECNIKVIEIHTMTNKATLQMGRIDKLDIPIVVQHIMNINNKITSDEADAILLGLTYISDKKRFLEPKIKPVKKRKKKKQ